MKIRDVIYNCQHATYLIEKRGDTRLSFKEKLRLVIHLAGCSMCRLYRQQSRQLQKMIHDIFLHSATRPRRLDENFKEDLQQKINQRMP